MAGMPDPVLISHGKATSPGFGEFRHWLGEQGRLPKLPKRERPRYEPARPASRPKTNVLWLMADQLRWDTFGFMNHPMVRTPNLDRLAARGTTFTRSYCSMGICVPSRASFFTGRYLYGHGALNNHYPMKPFEEAPDFVTFFRDAGYRCANLGKHHCGRNGGKVWEFQGNAEDAFGATAPTRAPFLPHVFPDTVFLGGIESSNPNDVLHGIYPGPPETSKSYHLANAAIRWLYYNDDPRPFLLRVSLDDPHPPVTPPEPYASMYDPEAIPDDLLERWKESFAEKPPTVREWAEQTHKTAISEPDHRKHAARYFGLVTHLDAQFGRVLDYLEAIGEAENTLILFNSDHGHMIGEHGLSHKGPFCYVGTAAIPTVLAWPGHIRESQRIDALVEGVDLAPTLCDLCEVPVPEGTCWDGHSWRPLLEGKTTALRHHAFVQYEDFVFCVVGERYKLTVYDSDNGAGELYDLQADRLEKHNLWDRPDVATIQASLLQTLKDWRARHARPEDHPHAGALPV